MSLVPSVPLHKEEFTPEFDPPLGRSFVLSIRDGKIRAVDVAVFPLEPVHAQRAEHRERFPLIVNRLVDVVAVSATGTVDVKLGWHICSPFLPEKKSPDSNGSLRAGCGR